MEEKLSPRRRLYDRGMRGLVWLCAGLTCALLLFLIGYIFYRGVPGITWSLLTSQTSYIKNTVGILPNILDTLYIIVVAMVIVLPLGVGAAIYLTEYASNRRLVSVIEFATETLTGIPSIIYGLFGMVFFTALRINLTLLSGALTLSLMVLPLILRTTEEALLSIPDSYREGSFGLGAGKLRTVIKIVLPPAMPGILSGVVLAIGRIVGETAALLFTAGTVADMPKHFLLSSGRTLAVHMYQLSLEGLHYDQAYATGVVLLLLVLGLNSLSSLISRKIGGKAS